MLDLRFTNSVRINKGFMFWWARVGVRTYIPLIKSLHEDRFRDTQQEQIISKSRGFTMEHLIIGNGVSWDGTSHREASNVHRLEVHVI